MRLEAATPHHCIRPRRGALYSYPPRPPDTTAGGCAGFHRGLKEADRRQECRDRITRLNLIGNYDDQPAILFQPVRASVVTASTFLVTKSQFTSDFACVPATASAI